MGRFRRRKTGIKTSIIAKPNKLDGLTNNNKHKVTALLMFFEILGISDTNILFNILRYNIFDINILKTLVYILEKPKSPIRPTNLQFKEYSKRTSTKKQG